MRLFGAALCAATLSLASAAHASDSAGGKISNILSYADGGIVFFNHDGVRSALPSCPAAVLPTRWAINVSTPAGQARLAVLLSAYSLGKKIDIAGTGTCTLWQDTETLGYFVIKD
ncbi:hypothetical protein ASD79_08425 [Caulobacter sp. Root655]|uniref:hypothetical protein n=1 Tax=Caulobacter sp. Root655 TaxID=1736578 RepID=UPI0006FDD7AC|nr:hypothetical protein [Caulobacter sp. Root655]KRA60252.1 hypothetical protein ASD79_08425 [Caulobacter sp. Root655]